MQSGFTALVSRPRLVVEISCVVLAVLVWFAGPWVGLGSVEARVKCIIAISVFRVLVNLIDFYLSRRNALHLEASLKEHAHTQISHARPDRAEEIASLRTQFETAIAALKSSKLGGRYHGNAALYALPWYMFIGPPGSGKSTALRHSGLHFPSMGGSGQAVQGLGGTRNCDWWFTNEGVLLDTAGRYVTQEEDKEEWLGFLDLLKKYRKGKAVNGVMAVISIADLMDASEEGIETHAKQMRTRIDELMRQLGVLFPVYVIFTKCDLVQGFVEFFEDLNKSEREQVWGCTLKVAEASHDLAQAKFTTEFAMLLSALRGRRLPRLAKTRGTHKINIFGFPLQVESLEGKLSQFIDVLFHPNPYQDNPLFRGCYFSSGTQEGTPIDRILGAVSRASGVPGGVVSSVVPTEMKSYFLHNLFTEVIFPDQTIAGPSSAMYRQQGYLRIAVFAGAVIMVAAIVGGLVFSFIGNKALISGTLSASLDVPQRGMVDEANVEHNIDYFEGLGNRLDQLHEYQAEGVPFHLWGMYQGDRLYQPAYDLYAHYFHAVVLAPTVTHLEATLRDFAAGVGGDVTGTSSDRYYARLKAYVMLGDPTRVNPEFLERWLSEYWRSRLRPVYGDKAIPEWIQQGLMEQMARYSKVFAARGAEQVSLRPRLIPLVQERLRRIPMVNRVYATSLQQAVGALPPYSLHSVLGGDAQASVTSDYRFPGLFTYQGWNTHFQEVVHRVAQEASQETWVLGESHLTSATLEEGMTSLYFAEYVGHWKSFLRSLRIRPTVTPLQVDTMLKDVSRPDSPFIKVLHDVDLNTVPGPEGMARLQETASGLFDKVKEGLGLESHQQALPGDPFQAVDRGTEFSKQVSGHFRSIHKLVMTPEQEGALSLLSQFVLELGTVQTSLQAILRSDEPNPDTHVMARSLVSGQPSDLVQAVKITDGILQQLDSETRDMIRPVFFQPLVLAMRGVMDRAKTDLTRRWDSTVAQACRKNIAPWYPFRAVGEDAALEDVVNFFHLHDGVLWKFFHTELQPFVVTGLDRWEPKTWNGVGLPFSPGVLEDLRYAHLLSESLFHRGASDLGSAFELYPYPPGGTARRQVSEIRLEVGGAPFRYRMEPQEWHQMEWPGPTPAAGASLQVQVGKRWEALEQPAWWGLFRLLEAGTITPLSDSKIRVHWNMATADGHTVRAQYDIKSRSSHNPFRPGAFQKFHCVDTL